LPDDSKCDIIVDCPPDSIYYINAENSIYNCEAFNVDDKSVGYTTAVMISGKGKLAVLGYDISLTKQILLCSQWRNKILDLLNFAGIDMPVYWQGPVGVQLFYYDDKVALANYNLNCIEGELIGNGKAKKVELGNLSLKVL